MTAKAGMPIEIRERIVDWLQAKGITPTATMKRHIMGLVKALETLAQMKR